jgi:CRP-like cAMP-binding protein
VIIKEGGDGDCFYILARGQISFTKGGKEVAKMDAKASESGAFFGERSLLKKEPRAATATVISDDALCLALTKSQFEELMGRLEDMVLYF